MKEFMGKDFLLDNETAKRLFFDYAAPQPIFDWHCHLSAKEIFENSQPKNLFELWLKYDHYKWRAMRSAGIDEELITGTAGDFEKFSAFAEALSLAVGNPLVHWSHLELKRYFDIETPLTADSAEEVWRSAQEKIDSGDFRPQSLIRRSNVFALCTTDDPVDSLEYHVLLKKEFDVPVLPAFRPDKAINIETHDFPSWLRLLEESAEMRVNGFADFKEALCRRLDRFVSLGCVATDQSVDCVRPVAADDDELEEIFAAASSGGTLSFEKLSKYKYAVLSFLSGEYAKRDLVMELHLGAMRNNNSVMFRRIGADSGFDSIGDEQQAFGLSRFLDRLNGDGFLPKTVLFCLNPKDNYVLGSMLGNFQDGSAFGKIQFGSGWWFNDNIDGMLAQMRALGNLGVLGTFVGMVTDSRSFLSYPRHEYFRRILCAFVGELAESGLFPNDEKLLKRIIEGVSFKNAKEYFGC